MINSIFEKLFKPNSQDEIESRRPKPKFKAGDSVSVSYYESEGPDAEPDVYAGHVCEEPKWYQPEGSWVYIVDYEGQGCDDTVFEEDIQLK